MRPPAFLKRLGRDASGLALIEFAISLPLLIMLSVTGVELANYVTANMRVSQIALSLADNTGRIRQSIDETDIDAAMIGARIAGESIDLGTNGRLIMSIIEPNGQAAPNTGQKIVTQRCCGLKNIASTYGTEGAGATNATYAAGFGPAGNKIIAGPNSAVVFVEAVYDYQPIFFVDNAMIGNLAGRTMRFTAAYPVRERFNNVPTNGQNLTAAQRRLCTRFSAT